MDWYHLTELLSENDCDFGLTRTKFVADQLFVAIAAEAKIVKAMKTVVEEGRPAASAAVFGLGSQA